MSGIIAVVAYAGLGAILAIGIGVYAGLAWAMARHANKWIGE